VSVMQAGHGPCAALSPSGTRANFQPSSTRFCRRHRRQVISSLPAPSPLPSLVPMAAISPAAPLCSCIMTSPPWPPSDDMRPARTTTGCETSRCDARRCCWSSRSRSHPGHSLAAGRRAVHKTRRLTSSDDAAATAARPSLDWPARAPLSLVVAVLPIGPRLHSQMAATGCYQRCAPFFTALGSRAPMQHDKPADLALGVAWLRGCVLVAACACTGTGSRNTLHVRLRTAGG
jgi:hypothetical protein